MIIITWMTRGTSTSLQCLGLKRRSMCILVHLSYISIKYLFYPDFNFRFIYPNYVSTCTDDEQRIKENIDNCTKLLWPKRLSRNMSAPFAIAKNKILQDYYWPDSRYGPYWPISKTQHR